MDPDEGAGEHTWAALERPPLEAGFQRIRQLSHLRVVEDQASEHAGQFVLDTGASYAILHEPVASFNAAMVPLAGISGVTNVSRLDHPRISLAGTTAWTRETVGSNLAPISEYFGVEIAGFLGFPALRQLEMSIDSRNGSIRVRKQ